MSSLNDMQIKASLWVNLFDFDVNSNIVYKKTFSYFYKLLAFYL